jgi:hypothetical protein
MPKTTVSFSLDTHTDRDLLTWLSRQDNRSAAIRTALRGHLDGGRGISLADVYQEIRALRRRLETGVLTTPAEPMPADEPPELALALDNLGL